MPKNAMQTKVLNCGVQITLAAIGGRWKLVIIYFLMLHGPLRFSEIMKFMPTISKKVLASQLRELEAEGILLRQADQKASSYANYVLTEYGLSLKNLVVSLREWGEQHGQRMQTEQLTPNKCTPCQNYQKLKP